MSVADAVVSSKLDQRVRFRCVECDVAWTALDNSTCWVSDEPGFTLRSGFSLREDDYLHLDFE